MTYVHTLSLMPGLCKSDADGEGSGETVGLHTMHRGKLGGISTRFSSQHGTNSRCLPDAAHGCQAPEGAVAVLSSVSP